MTKKAERRERWLAELARLAAEIGGVQDRWQLDLAARVLSDRPDRSLTGGVDVWVFGQTRAANLVDDMKATGRLKDSGNWPRASDGGPSTWYDPAYWGEPLGTRKTR